ANQGGLANYITPALTRETNFEVNVADAHPTFKSRLNSLNGVYYVTGFTSRPRGNLPIREYFGSTEAYERTSRRTEDTWFVVGQGSGVLQTLVYPSYDRKVPSTIKFKGAEFELKSVSRNGWFAMEIRAPNTETINWRENDRKFISNPIGESYFVYRAHLNSKNTGDLKDFALTLSRTPPREDEDGNAAANLENYPALRDWDDYFVLTIIDLTEPAAEEAEETPATEEPVAATPGEEETPAEEPAETPADTTISCTVTNRLGEVGNGIVWIINNLPDAVRSVTFNVVNPRTNPASATRSPFTLNRPTAADSWLITAGRGILNIPSRGATLSVEDRGTNPRNPHYQVRTATERSYSVRLAMVGGEPQEVPCNPPQASEEAQANGARRCSITVGPNFCWYNGKPRQYIGVSLTPPPNSYDGMRVIADAERGVAAQPIRFTQTTTSVNPDRRFLTCNNPTWVNNNMLLTLRVSTGELYQCRVPTIGWPTQSQSCTIRLTPNGDRCTVRLSARIEICYYGTFYCGEPRVLATDILHGSMLGRIGFNLVSQLDGTGFTIGDTVSISNAICARIRTTSNIVDITRTPAGGTAINYRCTIEGAAAPTSP
ncbi:TPA: hypothetical protein HA318_03865, partial [Candidatus Micrarchaeota archaeon]|nr:hypothetical protein [Candidatus Micrarchaeota archaeon]